MHTVLSFFAALPPPPRPPPPPRATPDPATASPRTALSRRALLPLLPLLPCLPLAAASRAADAADATSDTALVALVRLRDSLRDLSSDIERGTNADVRRVVRTLLRATDLPRNLPAAARRLPPPRRESALLAGRDAYEYLNQIVEYFDPMANRATPSPQVLSFWLKCIATAADQLDHTLQLFDADAVRVAREQVVLPPP